MCKYALANRDKTHKPVNEKSTWGVRTLSQCQAIEKNNGVELSVEAEECPWNTTLSNNHNAKLSNGRPDTLYEVLMVARCLWGHATLRGLAERWKYHAVISAGGHRTMQHPLNAVSIVGAPADDDEEIGEREEEIETEVSYYDSTIHEDSRINGVPCDPQDREKIIALYQLPMT